MNELVRQLKIPFLTVFLSLSLLYLFTTLFGPLPLSIKNTPTDIFTVNGTGEEKAIPDSSKFTVGVSKSAPTVAAATELVNTSTNTIIAQLKALGIEEKDIKTQNFSSYPNYDDSPVKPLTTSFSVAGSGPETAMTAVGDNPSGYTVSQDLTVTTKTVELANKAFDAALASGANQISGVSFNISDDIRKGLQQKARQKAIADAKKQAKEIAADAGIKLGRVVNIYIVDNGGTPVAMYDRMSNAVGATEMSAPTNLQAGEDTVSVTVTLNYETH